MKLRKECTCLLEFIHDMIKGKWKNHHLSNKR